MHISAEKPFPNHELDSACTIKILYRKDPKFKSYSPGYSAASLSGITVGKINTEKEK